MNDRKAVRSPQANPIEAQPREVEFFNEGIDYPNRIVVDRHPIDID